MADVLGWLVLLGIFAGVTFGCVTLSRRVSRRPETDDHARSEAAARSAEAHRADYKSRPMNWWT
jgi:hypothetical protein